MGSLGVEEVRLIRTTEAPRWAQNVPNGSLTLEEHYDSMIAFAKDYLASGAKAHVTIWQLMELYPDHKSFSLVPILCQEGEYRPHQAICKGARGMPAIASDGILYPCLQASGRYAQDGIMLGNVKQNGLQPYLQSGGYLAEVTQTVEEKRTKNPECAACPYFLYCLGGCPALSYLTSGSPLGCDHFKCVYFKEGFLEKNLEALKGFEWLNPIPLPVMKKANP